MVRRFGWLAFALPPVLAVACGLPALTGDFLRDDLPYYLENPQVVGAASLQERLAAPFPPQGRVLGLYRPLVTASFRLDLLLAQALFGNGLDPRAAHATNLVLAAAASLVLVLLARRLGWTPLAATMAASLFAAHAARTEAVCWVSGRAEDLMTLLVLGALLLAAGSAGALRTAAATALGALALLAKEQAALLPALALLLPAPDRRLRLRRATALALAVALVLATRWQALGTFGPSGEQQVLNGWSFTQRFVWGLAWLGDYARLVFWPWPLLNDYDDPAGWPAAWRLAAGSAVALAALAGVALLVLRDLPARRVPERCRGPAARLARPAFAIALFALPLLPVLNIVYRTGESFAERFLALPIAGAALALTVAPGRRGLGLALAGALIVLHAPRAFARAHDWRSERALYEAHVREAPETGTAWSQMAALLVAKHPPVATGLQSRPPEVLAGIESLYARALANAPQLLRVRVDRALNLQEMAKPRRPDEAWNARHLAAAETEARRAVADAPWLGLAHATLGELLSIQGRPQEAELELRRALELDPADERTALFLAGLLDHLGRRDEARRLREERSRR